MITVAAGANLQAALDAAPPGETLDLEAGATFVGNYVAPAKPDGGAIRIRHGILRTPNSLPAWRTAPGAARWTLEDVRLTAGASQGDIVQVGTGTQTAAETPRDIVFDRCAIVAEQTAKNGLVLNGANVTVRNVGIVGVKLPGIESHAIVGWNGPGPFLIEDCHLDAGSIGVLFGGAAPSVADLIPSDITFRRNTITRPLVLRTQNIGCKNLFELKNARRVVVTGNVMEHNWPQGQAGFAIVLTVRANSPSAPWSTIRDVRFESNIVRHSAMGLNILGLDDTNPSQSMDGVIIRNNLFEDLDAAAWGGNGALCNIGGAPRNLWIEHNTILHSGNVISVNGPALTGFRFVGNLAKHNAYGIFGDNVGTGNPAIARYFPDAVIEGNVLAGGNAAQYSSRPSNAFPTAAAFTASFFDLASSRSTLAPCGMDRNALDAACLPPPVVVPPPPPPAPTLRERLIGVASGYREAAVGVGGSVSPQAAYRNAVDDLTDAILAMLPAEPTP